VIRAAAARTFAAAVAAVAFVAIFFAAVAAFVHVEICGGPTDVIFIRAAVGARMNVVRHDGSFYKQQILTGRLNRSFHRKVVEL